MHLLFEMCNYIITETQVDNAQDYKGKDGAGEQDGRNEHPSMILVHLNVPSIKFAYNLLCHTLINLFGQ